MEFTKFDRISLRDSRELDEKWVQDRIAEDPAILGLDGDIVLRDKEKILPGGGRLDLLLEDMESAWRYEVEVQLGATDPSHIIRTIEYWDIERRRYPQYDHTAVIIAEDVTSRFLNVISLFNGAIPIMAIQVSALRNGNQVGLVFTTVVDEMSLGYDEEDEETYEEVDRTYWETRRGSKETVAMADTLLELVKQQCDGSWALNYNKNYISLAKNGKVNSFVRFRPKKQFAHLWCRSNRPGVVADRLGDVGLSVVRKKTWFEIQRLKPGEIKANQNILAELIRESLEMKRSAD